MKTSIRFVGVFALALLQLIVVINGYKTETASDMINRNNCICPCGNDRGGKLYKIPNERLNWFDAVAHCKSIGMSIVTIKDETELQQLKLSLRPGTGHYNLRSQTTGLVYWIGANNLAGDGIRWGLTQQTGIPAVWDVPSELDQYGTKPFCVYMLTKNTKWVPAACDGEQRQFICEY